MAKRKINVRESDPFKDKYGNIIIRQAHKREIEVKPQLSEDTTKKIVKGKAKRIKYYGKCKECGQEFPKDELQEGLCYTCYDDKEIINLWKQGYTKEEILDELDYSSIDMERIEMAIQEEIDSLNKQSPRE